LIGVIKKAAKRSILALIPETGGTKEIDFDAGHGPKVTSLAGAY
jgi:hypothetical protein